MKTEFDLNDNVCLFGYNQGGEGLLPAGSRVNRCVEVQRGYICEYSNANLTADRNKIAPGKFPPCEEIVIMCNTIGGHSGGPCVNVDGHVVGILSRSDPSEDRRCYLVPAAKFEALVQKAIIRTRQLFLGLQATRSL
jgi:hypothetical protein